MSRSRGNDFTLDRFFTKSRCQPFRKKKRQKHEKIFPHLLWFQSDWGLKMNKIKKMGENKMSFSRWFLGAFSWDFLSSWVFWKFSIRSSLWLCVGQRWNLVGVKLGVGGSLWESWVKMEMTTDSLLTKSNPGPSSTRKKKRARHRPVPSTQHLTTPPTQIR